jgi:hypothetical protein
MFARIRRNLNRFFSISRTINNEPLNKVSLIVLILIDIFILINVFAGLDDISRWHISPTQAYPCYSEWQNYRTQTTKDKDYKIVKLALPYNASNPPDFKQYHQDAEGHLGKVSNICLNYAKTKDKIKNSENLQILKIIDQKQAKITTQEQANRNIREQYNSTLLEKIANQVPQRSINKVGAEKAKQQLDQNNQQIFTLKQETSNLKKGLLAQPETTSFLAFLDNGEQFNEVKQNYEQASLWYPSIQLAFQSLFLIPLILFALLIHKFAQRQRYGLIALISWHLLVIFFIPLIIKVFEFLQVGAIFKFLFEIITTIFGGLLFLVSYFYILLIPLIGFCIIKFFQKIVFNPKIQIANRVQKSSCIKCAKKIRHHDTYCPHCGYYQYVECQNCTNLTYKHLPYCKECGISQANN